MVSFVIIGPHLFKGTGEGGITAVIVEIVTAKVDGEVQLAIGATGGED